MNRKIVSLTKLASSAMAVLLAGCGSAPLAPQRVEVPVSTPCVKVVPQRPAYEFDQLAPATADGGDGPGAGARLAPRPKV